MTHVRSLIVAAVKSSIALIPDFQGPGKCERGRSASVPQEMLPAVTLAWGEAGESSSRRAMAGAGGEDGYDRSLALSVVVHLRDETAEEEFDRLAASIETAMEADVTLGGLAVDLELQSSRLFVDPRTGIPLGAGSLTYRITYKTLAADPGVLAL